MTRKAAKWWLVMMGVGLPAFYILSPGPVMMLHDMASSGGALNEFLQFFYLPLEWLYDHVAWVKHFYEWWFGVWEL